MAASLSTLLPVCLLVSAATLAGCAGNGQRVDHTEMMLAAAGFQPVPAAGL